MSLTETVPTVPPSVFTCLSFHNTPEERRERKVKSSRRSSSRWCDVPPTIDEENVEVGVSYLAAPQGNGLNTRFAMFRSQLIAARLVMQAAYLCGKDSSAAVYPDRALCVRQARLVTYLSLAITLAGGALGLFAARLLNRCAASPC